MFILVGSKNRAVSTDSVPVSHAVRGFYYDENLLLYLLPDYGRIILYYNSDHTGRELYHVSFTFVLVESKR